MGVGALAGVLTLMVGCGRVATKDATGAALVTVQALQVSAVAQVKVTVMAAELAAPLVIPLIRTGTQFSALASEIPVGVDYTFTASAFDNLTPPAEIYRGSVTGQVIRKNSTANIVIDMNQTAPAVPISDEAPWIDAVSASSLRVGYGDLVQLKAVAHDPDAGQTAQLLFSWSATCGIVSDSVITAGSDTTPSMSNALFMAPSSEGACNINLTVTDPSGLSNTASFAVAVAAANANGNAGIAAYLDTYPVVTAMTANPAQLVPGAVTSLSVIATDVDGDPLTYAWLTMCPGSFSAPNASTTTFTLEALATGTFCDFAVVVTDGNFPNGQPKGGVTTNHLILAIQPIVVKVPPVITLDYQSRAGFAAGTVVGMAVAATDPAGGSLSYAWTTTFGPAPTITGPAALGLDPSQWTSAATFSSSVLPPSGAPVVITVTVTSSTTGQSTYDMFLLTPGPAIAAMSADRAHFTTTSATTQLSVNAVGAQGDVLLYAWSSDCLGTFTDPTSAFTAFTLSPASSGTACSFTVVVTDVNYPDGPANGGRATQQLTIPVLDCADADINACGGCGSLGHSPGSSCGSCGAYACSVDKSSVTCFDPGYNACGGCAELQWSAGRNVRRLWPICVQRGPNIGPMQRFWLERMWRVRIAWALPWHQLWQLWRLRVQYGQDDGKLQRPGSQCVWRLRRSRQSAGCGLWRVRQLRM